MISNSQVRRQGELLQIWIESLNKRRSCILTVNRNLRSLSKSLTAIGLIEFCLEYFNHGRINYFKELIKKISPKSNGILIFNTYGALPFYIYKVPGLLIYADIILGQHTRIILYVRLNKKSPVNRLFMDFRSEDHPGQKMQVKFLSSYPAE